MKIKGKEILVRKKLVALIEKVLRYYGDDMEHDTFKAILYGECGARTKSEDTVKNYFDAYMYLLSNAKSSMTAERLGKFFFILGDKPANEILLTRISSMIFKTIDEPFLKKLVIIPKCVYRELHAYGELQRTMISLMIFNFVLVREGIPTIPFLYPQLSEYLKLVSDEDDAGLEKFIKKLLSSAVFQDKSYYKNLKEIDAFDIQRVFLGDKKVLTEKYGVKHIYIYGSFAKGIERIDSDIDLLCEFSGDLTYSEKKENAERICNHYFKVFSRYVDVHESGTCIDDSLIKEVRKYIKIF